MSKLINQTRLNQFTTKIWSKIKEKYNVSFKEVTLTDDKKLKFTKIEGTNTVDIDLVEYARLKDRNAFKQDKYEVKSLTIYAGNAFEVDVDICFWIIEKK